MIEKHLKKCSKIPVTREMQIKTSLRFYLRPPRMAKIKTQVIVDAVEDVEKGQQSYIAGVISNWINLFGN